MNVSLPKFFLSLLAALAALCTAGCRDYDTVSRRYSTLAEAQEDIQKGWIPACLPPSSHSITDSHDLDTNVGHGTFKFAPADFAKFQSEKAATDADFAARRVAHDEWKPLANAGYHFVAIPEFIIAVHPSGKGRYWLSLDRP